MIKLVLPPFNLVICPYWDGLLRRDKHSADHSGRPPHYLIRTRNHFISIIMVAYNVIIFGAATIDRSFVLKLAGALHAGGPFHTRTFKIQKHSANISHQPYTLYDTAGLTESDRVSKSLTPREALGNLYRFTRALDGGINLLIYFVRDQPSPNNFTLFHDYLCQGDSPIILVTVTTNPNPTPSMPDRQGLTNVFLHPDGAMAEANKIKLQKAITGKLKKNPKVIQPMERFEQTAMESWKLLERAAGWSFGDCREALQASFQHDAFYSAGEAGAKCQAIVEYIKKHYLRNVIVFGDTGSGKTSVIAMFTEKCEVDTDNASSAGGSTSNSTSYKINIGEYHYMFHDTVGFDDATLTTKSPEEAIKALRQLMLKVEGGISLLVYVHRGKIKPSQVNNYRFFSHILCQNKVPTALVVTGLEAEESRDKWWDDNKHLFDAQKIDTKYHACITATKGKFHQRHQKFIYHDEYEESREQLTKVFLRAPLETPWKVNSQSRWASIVEEIYKIFAEKFKSANKDAATSCGK